MNVKTTALQLDMSASEKGIYFIQVQSEKAVYSEKIILE